MKLDNLIEIRQDNGLSQTNISNFLKITRTTYNSIENGIREIRIDELYKLAILFNVEILFLTNHKRKRQRLPRQDKLLLQEYYHISDNDIAQVQNNSKYNKKKL